MNAASQPLVSVLTPVYNGEKYLVECIESVLAQTYQNWEYCIVNNCSTDRTLEIAQSYAERDRRIRVHNNSEFVGCDQNGNIAFQQISSESKYCKVVHADDWLFPECITRMVELAEVHPNVAIVGSYGLRNEYVSWDGLPYPSTVVSGRELCRNHFLGGPYVFGSPTSMLICADEVRKRPAFYNVANLHTDIEACLDILRDRDYGFVHQVLTFTREHAGAESTSFHDRFGTDHLGWLEHLPKYGRTYLSEKEYEVCMRRCWQQYYAFLGSCWMFCKKEKGFWEFHRKQLGKLGYSLNYGRLAKAVLVEVLDVALNPLHTSRRIARKVAREIRGTRDGGKVF
jgi:glycosyltransferase involved in cell wall biosynthesis